MENFASILERDYGFKSGKNAPMVSGPAGGSGGGGGSYGSSGLRKSVPSSRMSANVGVFGSQDDPFSVGSGRRNNLNSNNEGSRSSRTSYGSRDDLFTPPAYDDVFGGPPKSSGGSESGARYDDVFGGGPQGAPVYDDLLGGFGAGGGGGGGTTPTKVNKSASGSFHSSPRRSDRTHFAASSAEPAFDELLPGFGFLPKSRVATEAKGSSHQNNTDPFADPLTSTSGLGSSTTHNSTPFDDDSLLPGFESAASKSRSYSGGDSNKSSSSSNRHQQQSDPPLVPSFDDPVPSSSSSIPPPSSSSPAAFEDDGLIPGFGGTEGVKKSRSFREAGKVSSASVQDSFLGSLGPDEPPASSSIPSGSSPPLDDPFSVFSEPQVNNTSSSRGASAAARGSNGVKVERYDSFDSFPHSPANSSFFGNSSSRKQQPAEDGIGGRATSRSPDEMASAREGFSGDDISGASPDSDPFFPTHTEFSGKSAAAGLTGGLGSSDKLDEEKPTAWDSPTSDEPQEGSSRSNEGSSHRSMRDLKKEWLTIDDLRLMTQPSPFPPARRPPPLPGQGLGSGSSFREKSDSEFVPSTAPSTSTPEGVDIMGGSSSSAAAAAPPPPSYQEAVPGWMDFKIQPNLDEEKEREEARAARERRRQERDEARAARDAREKEREVREKEMKEREARQAREQERLRRDKEREKDRAAVRIATLEARERAAQEAREKAERSAVDRATGEARERAASQARMRVERAAVDRANAEARERAEVRAAVEKAQAEARERAEKASADKAAVERAAAEARERSAQKAAAERAAVERAQSEARERAARAAAEKAAVERAAAEARERAERAAAEKAAAARERERAQQNHRKSENDLESFFGHSSTSSSTEARRPASMNNSSNVFGGEPRRTTSGTATAAASVDDWTTIFGATPSSEDSQRGDTKVSRGKSDRMAHTRERAAKAIAEINQRDLELQREQAEKHRAAEVLDAEIKRWAAGKEGNLRALLSTLQYVLWPECGWTAVSLTDLINPTAVKKTYRKATLYVHPDKVQQKGATVQQKYIAEKVFDLLKEASNKFNSEELF